MRHLSQRGMGRRAVVMTLAGVGWTVPAAGHDGTLRIPFTPGASSLPDCFSSARTGRGSAAAWAVVANPGVPGGHVLAQTSTDPTGYRFPLAIYDPLTVADLHAAVRFKAMAGRVDRAAGVAIRLIGAGHYYVVRANALEDNATLYRVVRGVRSEIRGMAVKVVSGTWHTLELAAEADRLTVTFDDAVLFTAIDDTLERAGKVALWTKADSVTHFAGLTIAPRPW